MFSFFGRTTQVLSVIFLSFVLGAILMALTAYFQVEYFDSILDTASDLKAWLSNDWLPLEVNVWFKFLLKDEALVLMFFTMAARVLLYMCFALLNVVTASFRTPTLSKYEVRALIDENKRLKGELQDAVRAAASRVKEAASDGIGKLG